jgi:hypothetical protein
MAIAKVRDMRTALIELIEFIEMTYGQVQPPELRIALRLAIERARSSLSTSGEPLPWPHSTQ